MLLDCQTVPLVQWTSETQLALIRSLQTRGFYYMACFILSETPQLNQISGDVWGGV